MKIYRGFDDVPHFDGAVATVGSFDGLHGGHMALLNELKKRGEQSSTPTIVLTFDPHPRVVLGRSDGLKLLTSLDEKVSILEGLGIDYLIVIPFDREFSRMSYADFVTKCLVEKMGVSAMVVGYNHQMGRDSEGSYSSLVRLGQDIGFDVILVDEWRREDVGQSISSTVIRNLVQRGDIEAAVSLLHRPYMIEGRVDDSGRVWYDEPLKLIPAAGRYAVLINGVESSIEIDSNGVITSNESKEHIVIEMRSNVVNI